MSEAYREASSVLDLVLRRKASLKAAALAPSVRNKRRNKNYTTNASQQLK